MLGGVVVRTVRASVAIGRAALIATTVYLDVLAVAALTARQRRHGTNSPVEPSRSFAVLIPAHNEERLIGDTVASLVAQDYPSHLRQVHVVADNCSDGTSRAAADAGAEVHERFDQARPGKGPALQWLMARLDERGERPDAYVFVDADTVAEPQLLRAFDRELTGGARVVQGHYGVRDPARSPVVAFRAAAMALRNYVRPLGRTAIGGSAGLYGNGMAFTADVMRERRWSDHLTEDVELGLDLLLDGTLVAFAPDAAVSAEMPDTLDASTTQHERWERGRLELTARYVPVLLRRTVTGGRSPRIAYLDAAMDQLVPPLSVVVASTAMWTAVASLRRVLFPSGRGRRELLVAVAALVGQGSAVLAALRMIGAPVDVYRSLLTAPRMLVWKLGVFGRVLRRPETARWVRTARN